MIKRIMFGGLLLVAASCGDSKDVDKNSGDGGNSKSSPATSGGGSGGSSSSSSGGASGSTSSNTGSGDGGPGSSAGGSSSSSSGGNGGSSSSPSSGTPADGTQLAQCAANDDCNDGLNCYVFGRYCSAACATDADCSSLGAGYTCNARTTTGGGIPGGGGAFPGGGAMGADAAAPMPTGTCRLQCTGTSDTSCPSGMSCVSAGGITGGGAFPGGMGAGDGGTATMGTFRCQYPMEAPMGRDGGTMGGDMMGTGTTPAFGQCMNDSECADGLNCTAGRTSSGYCTETCDMAADCTMMPGSGTAMPTCSAGGNCTLSCAAMGTMCPTGMTCVRAGGGGPGGGGTAFCNFMSTTNMMPGGGFPGGGG